MSSERSQIQKINHTTRSTSMQEKNSSCSSSSNIQMSSSLAVNDLNTNSEIQYQNVFYNNQFDQKQGEMKDDCTCEEPKDSVSDCRKIDTESKKNYHCVDERSVSNEIIKNAVQERTKQKSISLNASASLLEKNNSDAFKLDYDDVHDDLENIFGMSLAESEEQSNSIFRQTQSARGLSPIEFTPPDSPHEELTLDMLFGIDAEPYKPTAIRTESFFSEESTDTSLQRNTDAPSTTMSKITDTNFSFTLPSKKIPVYKQKTTIMPIEKQETTKAKNPNYDEFEFQDDELQFDFILSEKKHEPDTFLKNTPTTESVYIPGKGFRITNKPKNELLSTFRKNQSKTAIINNDGESENVFFTTADSIRKRKDQKITNSFMQPIQLLDNDCTQNRKSKKSVEPALPKIIICIEQCPWNYENDFIKKKRYGKRAYDTNEEDSDWDENVFKRSKMKRTRYSLHEIDAGSSHAPQSHFAWDNINFIKKRLDAFGHADGILPKGTYVVCKSDLLNDDCALWRVDNQTLLQKFHLCQNITDKAVYKSSSTYSGWCEQISSQYFRVSVKVLKQTRSEVTIEPEIPLVDLFPAVSTEMFRTPKTVLIEDSTKVLISDKLLTSNTCSVALETLIKIYLHHSFSSNFLEELISQKDWSYTRSLSEINNKNYAASSQIKQRIPIEKKHRRWISEFTRVAVTRSSFHCITKCQICKKKKPRRVIHFFDQSQYDFKLLMISDNFAKRLENSSPVVVDAISCGRCSTAIKHLHSMKHIHLHLLRICEEKIEEIGTCELDVSIEKTIQTAKLDKLWITKVIEQYNAMWEEIRLQFRND